MISIDAFRPLVAESLSWRLLALLFERPRPGWREEIEALIDSCGDEPLREAARAAIAEATEGAYLAVLGPGGRVSAREAGYQTMRDTGRILAEIRAFYDAFAYEPRTEDPPDHVAVEIGFVGYLLFKEAYAMAESRNEDVATVAGAREEFLSEHLASISSSIAAKLRPIGIDYLSRAAALLAERAPSPLERANAAEDAFAACSGCAFEE